MKIPEPRRLPSGNWFIRLRLGGQSIPITEPTRADCVKTARLVKAQYLADRDIQRKAAPPAQTMTLGELLDNYREKYQRELSPGTLRGYGTIRRNRFQSIMSLRPDQVKDWQKVVSDEYQLAAEKTVQNAWGCVTAALRDAKLPVPEVTLAPVPEADFSFLEPEEIPPFLDAIRGDPVELEMLLELHGLRLSEVLQVVRNDRIDLRKGNINVHGAIVRGDEGFVAKKTNKSKTGTRVVPILIPRLSELVEQLRSEGRQPDVHSASMILEHVHAACARAGVTDCTNHDLRRTFASLGYSCGISERVLMELGGWKDAETMHKIYVKLTQRDRRGAVNALRDFFAPRDPALRLAAAVEKLEDLQAEYGDLPELQGVFSEAKKLQNVNKNVTEPGKR